MKERIGLKALEIFLRQGYDNTPMSQIARETGLSKAGLYHHYDTKESLLYDLINMMVEKNFVPILDAADRIADPRARLIYLIEKIVDIMAAGATPRIIIHEAARLSPERFRKVRRMWKRTYDLFRGAIGEMQARGQAKEMNPAFAAFAAIGMISWVYYWFDFSRQESRRELADTFVEIFLRGLSGAAYRKR